MLIAPLAAIAQHTPDRHLDASVQPLIILFDQSASMEADMGGRRRIDIARESFTQWAAKLRDRTNVGIRFFASGTNEEDEAENCLASKEIITLGVQVQSSDLKRLAAKALPIGRKTNIAHALEVAKQDLAGKGPGTILLISDGLENCERDPVEQARELGEMGITVDVLGIGPAEDIGGLGKIALASGGRLDIAANRIELQQKMESALPNFDFQDMAKDMAGPTTTLTELIEVPGRTGPFTDAPMATPAPAIEPLILETIDVSESGPQRIAIELVLDVSGSMAGRLQNEKKIHIARRALRDTLKELKDSVFLVGLRAYGFDQSVAKTAAASCPNTELLTEIATNNLRDLQRQASNLTPYGYTPIAESLFQAGKDLQLIEADHRMIILITDGEETCGGDPIATAKMLCEMGIDLETHIVGFDLEPGTAKVMRQVAKAGCGTYVDAKNARELTEGLSTMVHEARNKIDPIWLRSISPVEGGRSVETALPITPGTYTLNRWLEKGEQMYFRVDTDVAQHGVLRGLIQSRRLIRKGNDVQESAIGRAQFHLTLHLPAYNPQDSRAKNKTRHLRLSGEPGTYKSIGYHDIAGEGFVFSIGSPYDRVHADSLFSIGIRESGDIYEGYDAPAFYRGATSLSFLFGPSLRALGAEPQATMPLPIDIPVIAHLGEGDRGDLFALPALTTGALIYVDLENPKFSAKVELFTQDGTRIARSRGVGKQISVAVPASTGPVNLLVSSDNPFLRQRFTNYTLTVITQ